VLAIIDYGMGNLRSILHKIEKLKVRVSIASTAEEIEKADKIILPGVGNFSEAMQNLYDLNLIDLLTQKVIKGRTPILGICLGMQLFTEKRIYQGIRMD
jgi:glutamine amidotransferase